MMGLKNHPDHGTQTVSFTGGLLVELFAEQLDAAMLDGTQAANECQQGRFPAAGGPRKKHKLCGINCMDMDRSTVCS